MCLQLLCTVLPMWLFVMITYVCVYSCSLQAD